MSAESFYKFYNNEGFNFQPEILTRYCLSLYTKPFVILSGISGTGKTKIAQLFNIPVNEYFSSEIKSNVETLADAPKEWITLTVREGMLADGRGNLPVSSLEAIYEPEELPAINDKIKELKEQQRDDNITEPSDILIYDAKRDKRVKGRVYLQRASSPLVRVRFKSKRGEDEYDSRQYFATHYKIGDVIGLRKTGQRQFEIITLNDKALVEISKNQRQIELSKVANFHFSSVRSDWTDSSPIVGFYNLVTQKYYVPPVLKFILTALEYPELPFFLLLDEMNLSKVEHYFSDVLSCMESRLQSKESGIVQEKIKLYGSSDVLETDDYEYSLIPSQIPIPLNLYITGTVNIDESTYMFSPKVLDRANVIEFNEVELSTYNKELNLEDENFIIKSFPKFGTIELGQREHYLKTPDSVKVVLNDLLNILKPYNLHFGYRIVNEFSHFVLNSIMCIDDSEDVIRKAIDIQIVQKVLPKFNGSFNKLDEPLRKLIAFLSNIKTSTEDVDIEFINGIDYSKEHYPITLKKLSAMYINLVNNGFTSYIE